MRLAIAVIYDSVILVPSASCILSCTDNERLNASHHSAPYTWISPPLNPFLCLLELKFAPSMLKVRQNFGLAACKVVVPAIARVGRTRHTVPPACRALNRRVNDADVRRTTKIPGIRLLLCRVPSMLLVPSTYKPDMCLAILH